METRAEREEQERQRKIFAGMVGQTVLRVVEEKTTTRVIMSGGYFIEVLNMMVAVGRH